MVRFLERLPDDPDAVRLLDAYLEERTAGFPAAMGVYRPVRPARNGFADGVFLVVVDDAGDAIGCAGIRRLDPATAGVVRYEVKHLYLDPGSRGHGIGRLLLEELERRARERGATETVLDTNRSLEAAGALYARLGYASIPPYNDNPNATDWYRKRLTPDEGPDHPSAQ